MIKGRKSTRLLRITKLEVTKAKLPDFTMTNNTQYLYGLPKARTCELNILATLLI